VVVADLEQVRLLALVVAEEAALSLFTPSAM
jgi:hypothetical protein